MSKEYTREEMLEWLKKHFKDNGYEVTPYSDEFKPARVPLYCKKEGKICWSKIPGADNKKLQDFLMKYFDYNWVKNVTFRKTNDGRTIPIHGDKRSAEITISEKEDKVKFKIDDGRIYNLTKKRDKEKDELYIFYIDEIIIEITTARFITKDDFFPSITIGEPPNELTILEASPVRFFQYYFPTARIYYAIPDYVNKNNKFNEFKKVCVNRGIGLLETPQKEIKEIIKSTPLSDQICEQIIKHKLSQEDIRERIGDYLENCLHYLVYYPDPQYRRSAIIEKMPGKINLFLIDKLQDLKHIQYADKLIELASTYRDGLRDDYDTVLDYINKLWDERLGLKYPGIQRHMEEILLRDEMYRDHFVHQFQVFLIGAYIIEKMYETKGFVKVLEDFEKKHKCKIEDVWLVASTYHDFNYGLQNFDIWLLQFFSDTLSINNEEAKENLNILNLDAAMVRESLSEIIIKMDKLLDLDEMTEKNAMKFFYEKATRDRNHGVLSALSIVKLCENQKDNLKIGFDAVLQAALAITCHDEDIWEALCGCKGFLRSNNKCEGRCDRELFKNKDIAVHKLNITNNRGQRRCEIWEQELMEKSIFQKIKFNEYPLIFLLILCDVVQEEGRITSMSLGDNPSFQNDKFDIKIKNSIFNEWFDSDKKLGEFKEKNKIKNAFSVHDKKISEEARIYKVSKPGDKRWKILDQEIVYDIEKKKGSKTVLTVKPRVKECSMNKIYVGFGKVKIDLIIDDLRKKSKELSRVSWALEDKRFKVYLREKDTIEHQNIEINGSGGG